LRQPRQKLFKASLRNIDLRRSFREIEPSVRTAVVQGSDRCLDELNIVRLLYEVECFVPHMTTPLEGKTAAREKPPPSA